MCASRNTDFSVSRMSQLLASNNHYAMVCKHDWKVNKKLSEKLIQSQTMNFVYNTPAIHCLLCVPSHAGVFPLQVPIISPLTSSQVLVTRPTRTYPESQE